MSRKIKASRVKNIVRVATRKVPNKRSIIVESILEKQYALFLEFEASVEFYEPQPETFDVLNPDGKPFKYTPDFVAHYTTAGAPIRYIEIKPSKYKKRPDVVERLAYVRSYFDALGYEFVVRTEEDFCQGCVGYNRELFYPYLHRSPTDASLALSRIDPKPTPTNVQSLMRELGPSASFESIATLIAHGLLFIDWTERFHAAYSEIWRPLNET